MPNRTLLALSAVLLGPVFVIVWTDSRYLSNDVFAKIYGSCLAG